MKRTKRLIAALAACLVVGLAAGPALAHNAVTVGGTVDCQGNYSITGTADVWGGVHLIVDLGGSNVYNQADNGSDHSVKPFGPITGSGGSAGEAIHAYTSDNSGGATGTLVAQPSDCTPPPTNHEPSISGSAQCAEDTAGFLVSFNVSDDGATSVDNAPQNGLRQAGDFPVQGTATFHYSDGPDVQVQYSVSLPEGPCAPETTPPPPPCDQTDQGCPTPPPPPTNDVFIFGGSCASQDTVVSFVMGTAGSGSITVDGVETTYQLAAGRTDVDLGATQGTIVASVSTGESKTATVSYGDCTTPTPTPPPSPTPPPVKPCKPQNFPCWHSTFTPAPPSNPGDLAFTGFTAGQLIPWAACLLLIGLLCVALAARRRSAA